ncbi:MAG TPA: PAS domain S-box protein [Myxococcales bacterium]|jgi:PAS domain S-box-containing protein
MAEHEAQTSTETQQCDMRLVAELASKWMAAESEAQVYQGLAQGLRQVVGEDAVIAVSHYDPKRQSYRPQSLLGLGSLATAVAQLLGTEPRDLPGDYPAVVKEAMAVGKLVRLEGGVSALADQVVPEAVLRQAARLLGLSDVYVVGFARGDFRGGISILTRREGTALRRDTIEALAHLAAVSIESKRIEARLRTMAHVVELAPSSITVHDLEGRCLFANRRTFEMHGYEPQEFLALRLEELDAPEDAQHFGERQRAVEERGEALFEVRHRRKDGTTIPLEVLAKRVEWQGAPALLGVATDIAQRKRAEAALEEGEARYRSVVDNIGEGLGLVDREERFLYANRAADEIFGVPVGALVGRSLHDFVDPGTFERMQELTRSRPANERTSYPFDLKRPDGSVRTLTVTTTTQYDGQGRAVGSYGIFRDVTERTRAEEERGRLESQLQQAQKMESVGRLAGGVAHDFNNMLGVILAHADVALTEVDPAGQVHNDLEEIRKAALRSASLTRQLLAFARRQTVSPRVLDLNQTIGDMLKMLQRLIGEDIRLQWAPGAELWPVKVDPSQIDQILANLCVNSRDAIAGVGQLTIETGNCSCDEAQRAAHPGLTPGDYVRLAVSDDGCGMDPQTLAHLFEPFFTTKGVGKGTGLGLATVYGIVKQNHGFIDARSEPGRGTTFSVHLPRHAGDARKAAAGGAAGEAVQRGHETILLVEDEPAILYAVKKMLERQGYVVLEAGGAAEALRAARGHDGEIDLLMTDVVMPDMNGRELARKLLPMRPELKLLFMSGYTADVIAPHGVLDEGVHFIQKPFTVSDLAAKVRSALGHHEEKC